VSNKRNHRREIVLLGAKLLREAGDEEFTQMRELILHGMGVTCKESFLVRYMAALPREMFVEEFAAISYDEDGVRARALREELSFIRGEV